MHRLVAINKGRFCGLRHGSDDAAKRSEEGVDKVHAAAVIAASQHRCRSDNVYPPADDPDCLYLGMVIRGHQDMPGVPDPDRAYRAPVCHRVAD